MMKWMLYAACIIFLNACEKEPSKTKKDVLIAKRWAWSAYKHNGIESALLDCEKDDYYMYASNGTYQFIDSRVKCSNFTSDKTGTWSLSEDEKTLTMGGIATYTVDITETQLKLFSTVGDYEFTYVAF